MLVVLASLALMVLDHRQRIAQPVRTAMSMAAYPIHAAVDLPFRLTDYAGEQLTSRRALIEENDRLRAQQLIYEARLLRLDALERENINLRDLLESSYQIADSVLIAELVRVDLDPYSHLLEIGKGSNNQVYLGQPVLDAKGVMGQIDEVGPFSAIVRLITDPSHAIPVQVARNGVRGIAVGTGDINRLELTNIPNSADIQIGDQLVTSGLGGRFPPGYPVATVVQVDQDPARPFARIKGEPSAALDRGREVLLVRASSARRAGNGAAAEAAPP